MNELSARAKELANRATFAMVPVDGKDSGITMYDAVTGIHQPQPMHKVGISNEFIELIEQALLAERKSVWAEAAKIAESVAQQEWTGFTAKPQGQIGAHSLGKSDGAGGLAQILRAAAEKEVGK